MAISVIQMVSNADPNNSTQSASIAVTINNVVAGNILHVFTTAANGVTSTPPQFSISDNRGSTYVALTAVNENSRQTQDWYLPNAPGGTITITVANSLGTANWKGVAVKEIGGSSGYQGKHSGQAQSPPGAGTDAISSGSMTPSTQPALVSAFTVNTGVAFNGSAVTAVVGTNYTLDGSGWTWGTATSAMQAESQRITSTSAIAGTFTATGGTPASTDRFKTTAAVFTEGSNAQGIAIDWVSA